MTTRVVIVGTSVAGVRTAQALRAEGFGGQIVLVGQEPDTPYDKPPLSKQFLSGTWSADRILLLDREAAKRNRIELHAGVAADHLDVTGHRVILANGDILEYDAVVIATGSAARPPPWHAESGVHVLRTLEDGRKLRLALQQHGPVVVVGGGFIGAEVAAAAQSLGRTVTIVDPLETPIGRVVGTEVGTFFTELHHRYGVETRFGQGVASIEGRAGELEVLLTDGSTLSASTVLVGIGAVPNDDWLTGSGLLIDDGVVCDEYCRSVDAPDVFAAGDVARWWHPRYREHTRVEHWTNAVEQAANVAHNLVHSSGLRPYDPVEYVWSDQYDWKVQIAGRPSLGTRTEIIGDLAVTHPKAAVLYTDSCEALRGVVTINWPRALAQARRLLLDGAGFAEAMAMLAVPLGGP